MGGRGCCVAIETRTGGALLTALLLDTSVLIAAERGSFNLDRLIDDVDDAAIAAITVAELGVGVAIATGRRRSRRQAFLTNLVDAVPVLPYDLATARAHSTLLTAVRRAGRHRGAHDLIIAATALATGRVVVTSDRSGFDRLPGIDVRSPNQ